MNVQIRTDTISHHSTNYMPTLLHGSECWTVRENDTNRINILQNKISTLIKSYCLKGPNEE